MSTAPTIKSNLTVVNYSDQIAEAIRGLYKTYIPGLPNFYKGLRPIGSEEVLIPCTMLQPTYLEPRMITTGKYQRWYTFDHYFVVGNSTVDATVADAESVAEILSKLYSNNALGDLTGGSPTFQFKTYTGFWVNSEMSRIQYSTPLLLGRPGPKYYSMGHFELKVQTFAVA